VVVDLQTGEGRTIASKGFSSPCCSADGEKLAILLGVKYKPTELCIVSSEGVILKTVALQGQPRGRILKPDWSPDGKKIALAVRTLKINLFLMKNVIPGNQR